MVDVVVVGSIALRLISFVGVLVVVFVVVVVVDIDSVVDGVLLVLVIEGEAEDG